MRRIIQNTLFIFLLVPAMVQSGMAKWAPHACGETAHHAGAHATLPGPAQEGHAQHDHRGASGAALDGSCVHRHLTCIGCGCPGGTEVMLVTADPVARDSDPAIYENLAIVSVASIALVPPTPPPRS